VAYGRQRGLSVRRACTLFSVARSALSYQSCKAARDAPVIARMKALAAQYPRYGYRRIRIFLGRDGHHMSPGRAWRLWQAAGLQGRGHKHHRGRTRCFEQEFLQLAGNPAARATVV
jgi:putative transposase